MSEGRVLLVSVALAVVERLAVHGRRKVGGNWPRLSSTARLSVREIMLAIVVLFWYAHCRSRWPRLASLYLGEWMDSCGQPGGLAGSVCLAARPLFGNPSPIQAGPGFPFCLPEILFMQTRHPTT